MDVNQFFGYVDFTDDGRAFYVGIGDEQRLKKIERNSKHKGVRTAYGWRQTKFQSNVREDAERWEVATIVELKT